MPPLNLFGSGFLFSEDESTALVQQEGGPCAVIAPVQSFLLKNILFSNSHKKEDWRRIGGIVFLITLNTVHWWEAEKNRLKVKD